MTPEQYLEQLILSTGSGWLATSPQSELRNAIDKVVRLATSQIEGIPLEQAPSWLPTAGSDPLLMHIRDGLLPHFPPEYREELALVPVGTIYSLKVNGFAARVPDGPGAVVCVDLFLKQLLSANNLCIHGFDPAVVARDNAEPTVHAYAAAYNLHLIHALLGKCDPPLPPKIHRDREAALAQAFIANQFQLRYVLAHEYAHIALKHVQRRPADRNSSVVKVEELEADELAARVLLAAEIARPTPLPRDTLERQLGAIYAVFVAAEALQDVVHVGQPFVRTYPPAEDRFDQIIEVFRQYYGPELMAAGPYLQPFALISTVFRWIPKDPEEAVGWLSEIAQECQRLGAVNEERFVLRVASAIAKAGGEWLLGLEIDAHLAQPRPGSATPG